MPVEFFSKPSPGYRQLVTRLYGVERGDMLFQRYERELGSALWKDRLTWFGVGVHEGGEFKAHAIVQLTKDRPLVYVGYVEALPDRKNAELLVQATLAELGGASETKKIYLPVNLSVWHTYRFKTHGDESLPFEALSQSYYASLFEHLLPHKEEFSSYRFDIPPLASSVRSHPPYSIRRFSPEEFSRDLRIVYELSADIFGNRHSVPSFEEFCGIYGGAGAGLDPRYVLFAEEAGRAVGFIYALRRGVSVHIKTFGVRPDMQRRGVGTLLFEAICRNAAEDGCRTIYGLMIRNDRPIIQLLPRDAKRVSEYVLYWQD